MTRHKRGGAREGAGAPKKYKEETKAKTFRFPLSICEYIESQDNGTKYLIELIGADMRKRREAF